MNLHGAITKMLQDKYDITKRREKKKMNEQLDADLAKIEAAQDSCDRYLFSLYDQLEYYKELYDQYSELLYENDFNIDGAVNVLLGRKHMELDIKEKLDIAELMYEEAFGIKFTEKYSVKISTV